MRHGLLETFKALERHSPSFRKVAKPIRALAAQVLPRPDVVTRPFILFNIELTNKCPMRCIMCPRTFDMKREQGHMDFELYKKAIDEYVSVNPSPHKEIWLHHFGESLVHPDFDLFIRYGREAGIAVRLSINPIMLKPETARKLLAANPATLYMSLDGHDDASFEQIRGVKDAYEKSKENLLGFLKLKKEMSCDTEVIFSMVDFEKNRESIAKVRGFWEAQGIDEFLAKEFVTFDGSVKEVNDLDQRRRPDQPPKRVTCLRPWFYLTIAWDGTVVPCCFDHDAKYKLGNVRNQTLTQIWNGEPMQALRREFKSTNVTNPLCAQCSYLRA